MRIKELAITLDDERFLALGHRVPGSWFLQGFLSEESARTGEPPILAAAGDVPSGADLLTLDEAEAVINERLQLFLDNWDSMRAALGR